MPLASVEADDPGRLPAAVERNRIIGEPRAADLCGVSVVHFRRLRRDGAGPRFVRLGERRLGYRIGDVLDWIEARLSDAPAAAA